MLNTRQKGISRKLKRVVAFLIVIYVIIGASLYFNQERFLFLPTILPQDYEYSFSYPFKEVFLETDGGVINMIHFKREQPKGVILYFHGNAGDLSRWGITAEYFVEKQYDVLIMDYRTYGKSRGKLSEEALYSDALYCYNYLKEKYEETNITVYGRSLGTGMATYVASNNHPKQLILETPYYSIADIAQSRFPMFPTKWLLNYKFESFKYISNITCPITIFHGTNDRVVPYASAKKLLETAANKNVDFVTIEGGNHNNLRHYKEYQNKIDDIIK
ncbi:alpha/beta hydrolase [Seonamhaeicola sp.]|uniref:alpha/beta hydrolase n=1 Tax=Seonamhaeicola sp. TaxID=1912245 RepID=UPI0026261A1D|nr:alpha/beta hydrolase [Seonamhaeicola sp.]